MSTTHESAPGRQRPSTGALIAVAAVIALVAGLIGGLIGSTAGDGQATADGGGAACTATTIAESVLPTVVTIAVTAGGGGGTGSGEVIRDGGYVLTNDHVISAAGSGGSIGVLFSGGQTVPATIVGRAVKVDLAVLKVDPPEGVPVIGIGNSASLRVGQPVVALGAPLGLSGTVTAGIVSALGRDVPVPADGGTTAVLPGAVQTDASINPGNSGGALVDCAGDLVGVNTAIATVPNAAGEAGGGSVGIGFAIPVDVAMVVADQLIAHGSYTPPTLGVQAAPVTPAVAEQFDVPAGLYLRVVTPGGPADKAGLRTGDVVTAIEGRPMTGPESLFLATVARHAGDEVRVEYHRDGKNAQVTVVLA
jgi:putative serine protease PepD